METKQVAAIRTFIFLVVFVSIAIFGSFCDILPPEPSKPEENILTDVFRGRDSSIRLQVLINHSSRSVEILIQNISDENLRVPVPDSNFFSLVYARKKSKLKELSEPDGMVIVSKTLFSEVLDPGGVLYFIKEFSGDSPMPLLLEAGTYFFEVSFRSFSLNGRAGEKVWAGEISGKGSFIVKREAVLREILSSSPETERVYRFVQNKEGNVWQAALFKDGLWKAFQW